VIDLAHARRLALALPEAVERDHHGMPSFRVRGKIFATAPGDGHLRVRADEGEIRACVAQDPAAFAEFWWGSRWPASSSTWAPSTATSSPSCSPTPGGARRRARSCAYTTPRCS
jgi:hypothetical protein